MSFIEPYTIERAIWWLGETKGFWIQTGVLSLSAIGALWIVRSREKSERRRATVDLVLQQWSDDELIASKREFRKLLASGNLARFVSQRESPEFRHIMRVLNTHEFVCCGIRGKAYDEDLYKRMQCSITIREWEALNGFIGDFRSAMKQYTQDGSGKTYYQDFEYIAKKWQKKPLNP